jgi:hypothetical protein
MPKHWSQSTVFDHGISIRSISFVYAIVGMLYAILLLLLLKLLPATQYADLANPTSVHQNTTSMLMAYPET